jgi:hypothetical protein
MLERWAHQRCPRREPVRHRTSEPADAFARLIHVASLEWVLGVVIGGVLQNL